MLVPSFKPTEQTEQDFHSASPSVGFNSAVQINETVHAKDASKVGFVQAKTVCGKIDGGTSGDREGLQKLMFVPLVFCYNPDSSAYPPITSSNYSLDCLT